MPDNRAAAGGLVRRADELTVGVVYAGQSYRSIQDLQAVHGGTACAIQNEGRGLRATSEHQFKTSMYLFERGQNRGGVRKPVLPEHPGPKGSTRRHRVRTTKGRGITVYPLENRTPVLTTNYWNWSWILYVFMYYTVQWSQG